MFFVRLYSWLGLPNVRHFCRGPAPWRSNPPWGWDHMGSLRGWVVVLPKSLEYVFFKVGIIDIALQQIKNIMRQNAEKTRHFSIIMLHSKNTKREVLCKRIANARCFNIFNLSAPTRWSSYLWRQVASETWKMVPSYAGFRSPMVRFLVCLTI